jgi:hypothetical protein
MERRYEVRLEQMLAQAEVSPELMRGLLKRLETFAEPFAKSLAQPEQQRHAAEHMAGLLSKLERKTGEAIAYLHDQERQALQKFVGFVPWDDKPLLATLARQVGADLGEPDAVIVFYPRRSPRRGPSRSAWRGSGVAGSARSRTARSASSWLMFQGKNRRWLIHVFISPRTGPKSVPVAKRRVCPGK